MRRRGSIRLVWLRKWEGLIRRSSERGRAAGLRHSDCTFCLAPAASSALGRNPVRVNLGLQQTSRAPRRDASEPLEGDGSQKLAPGATVASNFSLVAVVMRALQTGVPDQFQHVLDLRYDTCFADVDRCGSTIADFGGT